MAEQQRSTLQLNSSKPSIVPQEARDVYDGPAPLDMPALVPIDQVPPPRIHALRFIIRDEPPPLIYVSDIRQLPMISRQFPITRPLLLQAIPLEPRTEHIAVERPKVASPPPVSAENDMPTDDKPKNDIPMRPRKFHCHPVHPGNLPKPYICEVGSVFNP